MGCPSAVNIGDNLVFSICTHDPDTGILTDADAPPVYRVYEDETATPILTGTMDELDDGNTTGFYTELIACTAANGFEHGKTYTIYIAALVDGNMGGICYGFTAVNPTAVADEVFLRDMDQVEATAPVHSLTSAVLKSVSRVEGDQGDGTLTTYRTNGTTVHMTQDVTNLAEMEPISGLGVAE